MIEARKDHTPISVGEKKMKLFATATLIASACLVAGAPTAFAATVFTGAVDSDFATAGNWTNGVPNGNTNNPFTINGGLTADLATSVNTGGPVLRIGEAGSSGALNINSGGALSIGSFDLRVGNGASGNGTVNINSGGTLTVAGGGADLFIGDAAGGQGFVSINAGGTLDARKAVEIINGTLIFDSAASYASGQPQDEFVVDNNGTLAFKTNGATHVTIAGDSLNLELGSASTLDMQLGGAFNVGDTWTIMTGISGFTGVDGGDGTGTFGTVADSNNANHVFTVHYGDGEAAAGEVVVELTAVPEPGSLALLALGGLMIARRRRG